MTENPLNGRAYARAQFTPTTEVGGSLAHILSVFGSAVFSVRADFLEGEGRPFFSLSRHSQPRRFADAERQNRPF